jgi:hypothetical protein
MVTQSCCHGNSTQATTASPARRVAGSTKWIIPTAVLALLPKCPMCVAAYITLVTGLGVSISAATWIRSGVIIMCVGALTFLLNRALRSMGRRGALKNSSGMKHVPVMPPIVEAR